MKDLHISICNMVDLSMFEFFQQGIRGGMTFINVHNVKHIDGKSELLYIDANNLYGNALSYSLPCSNYEYIKHLPHDDLNQIDEWGEFRYTLEVDLIYPEDVQKISMDLPFAPEKRVVSSEYFSNYMKILQRRIYGCGK